MLFVYLQPPEGNVRVIVSRGNLFEDSFDQVGRFTSKLSSAIFDNLSIFVDKFDMILLSIERMSYI